MKTYKTDWLIIGSGAGGGTIFYELAKAQKNVLMIEEGISQKDEFKQLSISERTAKFYRNGGVTPVIGNNIFPFSEGRIVGGTTELNGALFWRTPDWIREYWQKELGLSFINTEKFEEVFEYLENLLCVRDSPSDEKYDLPSKKISASARQLGWRTVRARRIAPRCIKLNQCGSGCPNLSKNSIAQTLIPQGISHGGNFLEDTKGLKLNTHRNKVISLSAEIQGESMNIEANNFVVSGGAIQTPLLLHRSGLIKGRSTQLGFHLNSKILVKFDEDINAEKATIFTDQVQEFMRDGILIMSTNYQPEYVGMFLANKGECLIDEVASNYSRYALFTIQIHPEIYGKLTFFADSVHPTFHLEAVDFHKIKKGLQKACQLLFKSGAKKIYLPQPGKVVEKDENVVDTIEELDASKIEISSVHAMSSIPIRTTPKRNELNTEGKLYGYENLFIIDASMLPTTIGESPQGTIMALAKTIFNNWEI